MSRIHPARENGKSHDDGLLLTLKEDKRREERPLGAVLTVWKRSSMSFQGTDGFTVFDSLGRLVYRVDNYSRRSRYGSLVLMDGVGNPLITLKPQMLSMQLQWSAYKGESVNGKNNPKAKVFSMRSLSVIFSATKDEAVVFMGGSKSQEPDFRIEGSFWARDCRIRTSTGQVAAKILRKRVTNTTILLGDDVFSLVIQPGFDPHLMMAFIVILDRICKKPYAPAMCN